MKLKGGALYIAIFISLIVALLLSMIILMSYYHMVEYDSFLIEDRIQQNAKSTLNLCLELEEDQSELKTIDLYDTQNDSVSYKTKWWGCYKMVAIKAFKKNTSLSYIGLIGNSLPKDTCLITTEKNKPISVAGKTLFKGTCLLPKAGTKTAYVDGQNFTGDKVVNGKIIQAGNELPNLNPQWLKKTEELSQAYNPSNDSILDFEYFLQKDSIENSFLNKTLFIHTDGVLLLSNKYISGNIVLHSSRKIIIENNTVITNIVCIAPKIEIKKKVQASLQALATDTIITEEEVILNYPSSLVVYSKKNNQKQPALIIGEKNTISGQVVVINNSSDPMSSGYLKLSKESVVTGIVYCNGYLDFQAKVSGTVLTNSFLLVTPSSVYEGHVLNGEANRMDLSNYFVAGILFEGKRKKSIAKWLN
ncbi:MAG: hypothetical protein Q8M29_01195 [Bacteroidota bacterium]|nr:hypothetical protein [Bacteroidota bacterium]